MLRAASILLFLAIALVPQGGAEHAQHGACDETGLLVCVEAFAGGSAGCGQSDDGTAGCTWSGSGPWSARSPAGLSGEAVVSTTYTWTSCAPGACEVSGSERTQTCAWIALLRCTGHAGPFAGIMGAVELASGECVSTQVERTIGIVALVAQPGVPLASASWTDEASFGASLCAP